MLISKISKLGHPMWINLKPQIRILATPPFGPNLAILHLRFNAPAALISLVLFFWLKSWAKMDKKLGQNV